MNDQRVYSIGIATQIGRISHGQAASWAKNGTFVPSILYWTQSRPYSYLYSLADLLALRVISILRTEYGISLANAIGAAEPIRNTPDIASSEMHFQISDGSVLLTRQGDSGANTIVIGPVAKEVYAQADRLWNRSPDDYGKVERKRNVMHGALVVKGTRIPVSTVVALVNAGWDIDRIRQGYPTLHPEDIHGVMQYVEEQKQVA